MDIISEQYKITTITNPKDWNRLLDKFDDANIYQSWNYAKIMQNEKHVYHIAISDQDDVIGITQVRIKTSPLIPRGVAYIYSGPLWRIKHQEIPLVKFYKIVNSIKNEYALNKKLVLRMRPYIFSDENVDLSVELNSFTKLNFYKLAKDYKSLLLNINDDLDVINKNLKPRWRNYLNQSYKNDLQIVKGNRMELFQDFIGIYNQMMDRKKFKEYVSPKNLMELNDTLEDNLKLEIFVAYKDSEPIASLVGTAIGNTGIYLVGATNNRGLECRASYLLHWEMIKWMKSMGCGRYDLGGINKQRNPGGYKFKSGISKLEISDVGTFETSGSFLSKLILTLGERIYRKQ